LDAILAVPLLIQTKYPIVCKINTLRSKKQNWHTTCNNHRQKRKTKRKKGEIAMTLIRWNPNRRQLALPEEIDRFFNGFNYGWENSDTAWYPTVDISENENNYEVKAEIPGMKKEEIKLSVEDHVLTLSGEKKKENESDKKNYHFVERSYGRFERSFKLPHEVKAEEIKAKYKNGILSVEIPKTETAKPKEIAVS
jgi:HSP20 family protein